MFKIYPRPVETNIRVETFPIPVDISIAGGTERLHRRAKELLTELNIGLSDLSDCRLELIHGVVPVEGHDAYSLVIEVNRIQIESETEEGLAHGLASLAEVFFAASISDTKLVPTMVIEDAARLPYRGVIEG